MILKDFQQNLNKLECIAMLSINMEKTKRLKYETFFEKNIKSFCCLK